VGCASSGLYAWDRVTLAKEWLLKSIPRGLLLLSLSISTSIAWVLAQSIVLGRE
jgi:hypothetical protein